MVKFDLLTRARQRAAMQKLSPMARLLGVKAMHSLDTQTAQDQSSPRAELTPVRQRRSDPSGNCFGNPAIRREKWPCDDFAPAIGAGTSVSDLRCDAASSA